MVGTCNKCSTNCIFKEPKASGEVFGYPCDFCKKVLCRNCMGVSSTEIRYLVLSTRIVPYLCSDCVPEIKKALTLNNRVKALEDTLSEVTIVHTHKFNEFENQIRVITEEVKSLKTSFLTSLDDIKADLSIIKNSTSISMNEKDCRYSSAVIHGNVMHEVTERHRRSCNLMVFNWPLNNQDEDMSKAKIMLQGLVGSPVNILGSARIGKRNKNGHQALRLTLESTEVVHSILRKKRELDRSLKVFLEADLTSEQRAEVNTLKNELKERHRKGETDLILKYVNGIPKIITKKVMKSSEIRMKGTSALLVYFQNVRGLRTKLQLLFENASWSHYDILVFNETWLTCDINNAELQMPDYNIYRRDRCSETSTFSRGGGVFIAVRKTISSAVLSSSKTLEHVFVKVQIDNNKFIFATAYFPPRSGPEKYVEFTENVENLSEQYPDHKLCILGDFNLPYCQWLDEGLASVAVPLTGVHPNEVESLQILLFLCSYHNLYQVNLVRNANNNLLDLVFIQDSETEIFAAEDALLPEDIHHPPLSFEIKCESLCFNNSGLTGDGFYRDFHSMNVQEVTNFISHFNWDVIFENMSLDSMISAFL